MKNRPLWYFMHDGPSAFRFELAGELDNEGARRLQQDRHAASAVIGRHALIVDMTFVTNVDEPGRALLARWHAEGAQIVAKSNASRELAEAIIGKPLPDFASPGGTRANWTWLPFHTSFGAANLLLSLLLAAFLLPMQSHAANLKAETVAAWDAYVQSVDVASQDRARPGGSFLWTYEQPERVASVHSGEIVVAPAPGPSPRKVLGGLIHHWIGAAYLPHTNLDDVLDVTQDYDRYKEFYRPSVIESKTVAREDSMDTFSMVLMNRALFQKTALDADYRVTNVRLDDRRFYSVSRTTRVQEIEDCGRPSERRMPEGEGGGLIWKLFSTVRLEERDGGVYVEVEAVALSREIPSAARFVVDPIVRRVSRNSILTSIRQTEEAARRNSLARTIPAQSPSSAEGIRGNSAVLENNTSAFARVQ